MNQVKHSADFEIAQPVQILFPLFSAEGEKHWVPDWDYTNVMGSTDLHEDYVFITGNHDHAAQGAIWLVKKYEPENFFVEFYRVEPDDKIGIIAVQCNAISQSNTHVFVSYEYIALSETAKNFVKTYSKQDHQAYIDEWRQLLVAYFEKQQS